MTRTHKFLLWLMVMLALGTFVFGVMQFARMANPPAASETGAVTNAVANDAPESNAPR